MVDFCETAFAQEALQARIGLGAGQGKDVPLDRRDVAVGGIGFDGFPEQQRWAARVSEPLEGVFPGSKLAE